MYNHEEITLTRTRALGYTSFSTERSNMRFNINGKATMFFFFFKFLHLQYLAGIGHFLLPSRRLTPHTRIVPSLRPCWRAFVQLSPRVYYHTLPLPHTPRHHAFLVSAPDVTASIPSDMGPQDSQRRSQPRAVATCRACKGCRQKKVSYHLTLEPICH